jgi:hypothetical protein
MLFACTVYGRGTRAKIATKLTVIRQRHGA